MASPYASLMARYESFQSASWPRSQLKRYILAINGYRRRPGGKLVECFTCLTSINQEDVIKVFESKAWNSEKHHSPRCLFYRLDTLRCTICSIYFNCRGKWRDHHLEFHVMPDFTNPKVSERPTGEKVGMDSASVHGDDSGSGTAGPRTSQPAAPATVLGKRKHSDSQQKEAKASHSAESLSVRTILATFNPLDRTIAIATVDNVDSQKDIPLQTAADVIQRLCHTDMEIGNFEDPGGDLEILGMSVLVKMTWKEYMNLKVHVDTIRLVARSRS